MLAPFYGAKTKSDAPSAANTADSRSTLLSQPVSPEAIPARIGILDRSPRIITGFAADDSDGNLVVRISASGKLTHRESLLSDPPRVVLDFMDAELKLPVRTMPVTAAQVLRIRMGQFREAEPRIARFVFDLAPEAAGRFSVSSANDSTTVVFYAGLPPEESPGGSKSGQDSQSASPAPGPVLVEEARVSLRSPAPARDQSRGSRFFGMLLQGARALELLGLPDPDRSWTPYPVGMGARVRENGALDAAPLPGAPAMGLRGPLTWDPAEEDTSRVAERLFLLGAGSAAAGTDGLTHPESAYGAAGGYVRAIGAYEALLKTDSQNHWIFDEIRNLTRKRILAVEHAIRGMVGSGPAPAGGRRIPEPLIWQEVGSRCAIVDMESQTLSVFLRTPAGLRLERTIACSTGLQEGEKSREGDERTPEGVYQLVEALPASQLPEQYGALALPLDYPNPYDLMLGKTGSGIWIHGTNRPHLPYLPRKSHGCVIVGNEEVQDLSKLLTLSQTPMVITSRLRFRSLSEQEEERKSLDEFCDRWERSWRSRSLDAYLGHYSDRFRSGSMDRAAWGRFKGQVFERAGFIRLRTNLSFAVRHDDYVVVGFDQEYQSSQLAAMGQKRLFLTREKGEWKIVAEYWREYPFRADPGPSRLASALAAAP